MIKYFFVDLLLICFLISCSNEKKPSEIQVEKQSSFTVSQLHFGLTTEGDSIVQYAFANGNGLEIKIINYGCIVTHLKVPDQSGKIEDVVLGYDNLEDYIKASPYFGAVVGRYGNRIAKGKFTLDDVEYQLVQNNGENHLHGGTKGFDKVVWEAETFENDHSVGLKLNYLSKDMEEGYPGDLDVTVTYTIKKENEVEIDYLATTDKKTIVNLTQHSYFNLTGNTKRDILDHQVSIKSDYILPVDGGLIPTGDLLPVSETPFDFNEMKAVGEQIEDAHEQIKLGGGYDHCWVLIKSAEDALEWAIKAYDPFSGRVFELATTEPGVQFYTGNFLNGELTGKYGSMYHKRYGLCFEPEHYPDSPNQVDFPSVLLKPGEEYNSKTIWRFTIQK